jgi:hypothetical protein
MNKNPTQNHVHLKVSDEVRNVALEISVRRKVNREPNSSLQEVYLDFLQAGIVSLEKELHQGKLEYA